MSLYREESWIASAECLSIGLEPFFPGRDEDWNQVKAACRTGSTASHPGGAGTPPGEARAAEKAPTAATR